jgi:anti-anti-sigma regulatory factor
MRLPADCTIATIKDVCQSVRNAFRRDSRFEIDGSDVVKADLTSLQLLLSTSKTAQQEGRSFALTEPSAALRNTFQRAGLADDAIPVSSGQD